MATGRAAPGLGRLAAAAADLAVSDRTRSSRGGLQDSTFQMHGAGSTRGGRIICSLHAADSPSLGKNAALNCCLLLLLLIEDDGWTMASIEPIKQAHVSP
ncbi:hypothetical protein ABZP36_000857 [Zizania latifolia]